MNPKLKLFLLALSVMFLTHSCVDADYFPCLKPTGYVYEESRITANFTSIDLSLHADAYVTWGPENTVVVVAAENLLDNISTHSNGNTLFIDNTQCMRTRSGDIEVFITTPDIESVKLSGSGNIYIDSSFEESYLELNVTGSGTINAPELYYDYIRTSISGSGDVNLAGITTNHYVSISGSGRVNAYDLLSAKANVRISGSGDARLNVVQYIDASISGSGDLFYIGNPGLKVSITGSGSVNRVYP
jgi:hypothetical protein